MEYVIITLKGAAIVVGIVYGISVFGALSTCPMPVWVRIAILTPVGLFACYFFGLMLTQP